ncbi:MAG: 1,4-dihydroxy-2-naphthoate polyprenyltransferase [Chloroflexi bacterium]|nr:1,4-dihydroxy-2-naphthoate polyprenyltransferase [Chloroflexota bacterium]
MSARDWRVWRDAARPKTLPAGCAPVLIGTVMALDDGAFDAGAALCALLGALLIQVGTNYANDYFDFVKGADTAARVGPVRATASGLVPPKAMLAATVFVFALVFLPGAYLVHRGGTPLLIIGVVSILCGVLYTGGPWPLGYHGLGDLMVFVFFGLVAVVGTYYLQAETVSATAFLVAVPVGLLVTAILVVNNLRDIETDRRAGKRTLAVLLGERATRVQYALLVLGPYACVPALLLVDASIWVGLAWLTLPIALMLSRGVLLGATGTGLNAVLKRTAQLDFAFGALLALGLRL